MKKSICACGIGCCSNGVEKASAVGFLRRSGTGAMEIPQKGLKRTHQGKVNKRWTKGKLLARFSLGFGKLLTKFWQAFDKVLECED